MHTFGIQRSNLSNVQTFTAGNEIFHSGTNSAWSDNFIMYIAGVAFLYNSAETVRLTSFQCN